MASKQKAKFFCEFCGSEVAAEARVCPKCGSFFASVRCPQCGKTGTVRDFKKGCPRCHYAITEEEIWGKNKEISAEADESEEKTKKTKVKKNKNNRSSLQEDENIDVKSRKSEAGPAWLFFVSLGVLALILVMIFIRCQ